MEVLREARSDAQLEINLQRKKCLDAYLLKRNTDRTDCQTSATCNRAEMISSTDRQYQADDAKYANDEQRILEPMKKLHQCMVIANAGVVLQKYAWLQTAQREESAERLATKARAERAIPLLRSLLDDGRKHYQKHGAEYAAAYAQGDTQCY